MTGKTYHHGNLKDELVKAGVEILAEKGMDALTLRETARRAGVSHSAPYRHFESKEQLVGAIAAEGFRLLTGCLKNAETAGGGDFREELRLSGRAYVEFALANPEHLKVMFSSTRFYPDHDCIHDTEDLDAFARIEGVFRRAREAGVIKTEQPDQALALLAWSQVHGLSHILIEKQIPPGTLDRQMVLAVIDYNVELMWRGLRREG